MLLNKKPKQLYFFLILDVLFVIFTTSQNYFSIQYNSYIGSLLYLSISFLFIFIFYGLLLGKKWSLNILFFLVSISIVACTVIVWIGALTFKLMPLPPEPTITQQYFPAIIISVIAVGVVILMKYLYKKCITHAYFSQNQTISKYLRLLIFIIIIPIALINLVYILRITVLKPFCPDALINNLMPGPCYGSQKDCNNRETRYYIKNGSSKEFSDYNYYWAKNVCGARYEEVW